MKKNLMLLNVLMRTFFIQSWWNYKRLQNIGLLFALIPFLRYIHNKEKFLERTKFYTEYFNTNPYFAPVIIGALCNMEERLANGEPVEDMINLLKTRLMSTFGSIGDAVTWNGIRPVAAFSGGILAFFDPVAGIMLYLFLFNFTTMYIRFYGFFKAYKLGEDLIDYLQELEPAKIIFYLQKTEAILAGIFIGGLVWWTYEYKFFSFIGLGNGFAISLLFLISSTSLWIIIYYLLLLTGEKIWEIIKV